MCHAAARRVRLSSVFLHACSQLFRKRCFQILGGSWASARANAAARTDVTSSSGPPKPRVPIRTWNRMLCLRFPTSTITSTLTTVCLIFGLLGWRDVIAMWFTKNGSTSAPFASEWSDVIRRVLSWRYVSAVYLVCCFCKREPKPQFGLLNPAVTKMRLLRQSAAARRRLRARRHCSKTTRTDAVQSLHQKAFLANQRRDAGGRPWPRSGDEGDRKIVEREKTGACGSVTTTVASQVPRV